MSDSSRCGECGGALVFEEHLILTCESCSTFHGDAGLLADPTTSRTDDETDVIDAAIAFMALAVNESRIVTEAEHLLAIQALAAAVDRLTATEGAT